MSFPYSLSKKVVFESSDYWIKDLPQDFQKLFLEALKNVGYKSEQEMFLSTHSLFSIPFKFDVKTEVKGSSLIINYQLHLQNLINGIIVMLLLSTFLSRFEFGTFLWVSFIISVVFYQLSVLIIDSGIKKQIFRILSAYKKVKDESDIEYWVKENNRDCPACGAHLGNNSLFCNECGLKVRQNAYTKPLNINPSDLGNKANTPEFNYEYKENKNKEAKNE